MPAPLMTWKVLPHGPLVRLDDNIITVTGEIGMPLVTFTRRMTVVRTRDGHLVIYSAIALREPDMKRLEEFGSPAFLLVPSDHHRLDAKIWKDRYSQMKVLAPRGAREKVQEVVAVDGDVDDIRDPAVQATTVCGTEDREAALEVTGSDGWTLVVNDIIANIRDAKGFGGWISKRMGFAGDEPQVPLPESLSMIKDKHALAAQAREWAARASLRRILVSHGESIDENPAGALLKLADTLD